MLSSACIDEICKLRRMLTSPRRLFARGHGRLRAVPRPAITITSNPAHTRPQTRPTKLQHVKHLLIGLKSDIHHGFGVAALIDPHLPFLAMVALKCRRHVTMRCPGH